MSTRQVGRPFEPCVVKSKNLNARDPVSKKAQGGSEKTELLLTGKWSSGKLSLTQKLFWPPNVTLDAISGIQPLRNKTISSQKSFVQALCLGSPSKS